MRVKVKSGGWGGILLVAAAIAVTVLFWLSQRPAAPEVSGQPLESEQPRGNEKNLQSGHPTPQAEPPRIAKTVQQLVEVINRRLRSMQASGIVDFGGIMADLERLGLRDLSASEILSVIDAVDFGSPANESQGPSFLLEAVAEILRDKTTDRDVAWIDARFEQAAALKDEAKWLKVLETAGHAGNQSGYIQLLSNLPEQVVNDKMRVKAELVGRVLGRNGTEIAVRALLNVANERNDAKQLAVESAVGYVQNVTAIAAIAELIDGVGPLTRRQVNLATEMLGYIPSEYSVLSLKNLADDPDQETAQVAAKALSRLIGNNPGLGATQR